MVENSTATVVRASTDATTVVWLHDYWTDAYRTEGMEIAASLLDRTGTVVASWPISLAQRETVRIDVRDLCRVHGASLPFLGQLVLRASSSQLVAERPLQVMADYIDDQGAASGVHGQYGHMSRPLAQSIGSIRVMAGSDVRSGVVLTHTYASDRPVRPRLTVFDAHGDQRTAILPAVGAATTAMVAFDEMIPDLAAFLHGSDGHATIALPYPASRVLSFVEHRDGTFVVNHGTVDRTTDQLGECPREWDDSFAVATVPVAIAGCDVEIFVPNRLGRHAVAHRLHVDFFDGAGRRCGSTEVGLARDGTAVLALTEHVRQHALADAAHARISASPADRRSDGPVVLEIVVSLVRDGRVVAETLAGGGFFNDPVPGGLPWTDQRRTRIFTRAQLDPAHRTVMTLANPSSRSDYATAANPTLRVLALDGTEIGSFSTVIEPHGCVTLDLASELGDRVSALGHSGDAIVTVRDTGARLYGYCVVDRPGARAIRFDHMIGG